MGPGTDLAFISGGPTIDFGAVNQVVPGDVTIAFGAQPFGSGNWTIGGQLLLNVDGTLGNTGTTTVEGGIIVNAPGGRFTVNGVLNSQGTTVWNGGSFNFGNAAVFNNLAGATFEIRGDFTSNPSSGMFHNAGTLARTVGSGTSHFNMTVLNSGTIDAQTGTMHFGGDFSQTAGEIRLNGGSVSAAGTLDVQGGSITGSGTVFASLANGGVLAAGGAADSTSAVLIDGSYAQSASGAFEVELGGTAPADYDSLAVNGAVTLDGSFDVTLVNGFTLTVDDTFTIIDNDEADAVLGTFVGLSEGATIQLGQVGLVISYVGGDGNDVVLTAVDINVPVDPTPDNIQDVIDSLDTGTTTEVQAPAAPANIQDWLDAVAALTPRTTGPVIDIVLNLQNGTFGLGRRVDVPVGYRLTINGAAGSVVIEGSSPALTLASGDLLVLNGVTLVNSTDAPTILVTGGSLVLRDNLVRETTGGSQAAIEITGGNVDLGTADDLGGNTIDVSGAGELIRNLSTAFLPAVGNVYQVDGSTLTSGFAIEGEVFHGLDVVGLGVVDFADGSLYVAAGGSLQNAVDAAPSNATIHVASGIMQNYNVGAKLLTVAFENGPTVSQHADSLDSALRALTIIGTPLDDVIAFTRGPAAGVIQAEISGVPTGTFMPSGRLIASGEAGNDDISIDGSIALNAVLNGGAGHDRLKGGAGHDNILGGDGDDLLAGGSGRDFLIGGLGADRIVGNADEDILIAGTTEFDAFDSALAAIMSEWTSARSYAQRTANITGGSGAASERRNGDYFLNTSVANGLITVYDDNAKDMLTGASGQDWFFANLFLDNGDNADQKDKITDLSASEFALDLDFIGV